jgi:hypothetical protein
MVIAALALSLALDVRLEIDISALVQRHADVARMKRTLRCGIKVPGHTIIAKPGSRVIVRRRMYIVPPEGEVSFVDLSDRGFVIVNGRVVRLSRGEQDQFGFRRVEAGR